MNSYHLGVENDDQRDVPTMDATGLNAIEDLFEKAKREGTTLILSGVHAVPRSVMLRSGLLQRIGRENVRFSIDDALSRARELAGLA